MEKVILITGASGGMGNALAQYFAGKGYMLALHAHQRSVHLPESDRVAHFRADLTVQSEVQEMVNAVLDRFGRIDVLINNAGVSRSGMSWKITPEDWRATMALNLDAPFFTSAAVIPGMRAQKWGRIVNISSVVAQTGFIGTSAYAASKAGLIGLTKTLSKELISSGVSVNALALGYFNVGMIGDVPDELRTRVVESIPAGELGNPETVASTIEWLLSEEAGYVTGQTINLNGGLYS